MCQVINLFSLSLSLSFSTFVVLDLSTKSRVKENRQSSLMASEQKMKCLRKYYPSRRTTQRISPCLFALILLFALISLRQPVDEHTHTPPLPSFPCHCSASSLIVYEHGECFFDQLVCYPGYVGRRCEKRLNNEVRLDRYSSSSPKCMSLLALSIALS